MLIRDLNNLSELIELEELQKEIWGVEDREVLPALAMIPLKRVGGIILGAFEGEELVGFAFAFPGIERGRSILHSDMLAVKSAYRSRGLGLQLKLAQRERALEQGVDTITWTFDPLQSPNARLNFGKLGVIADRYYVDFYGNTTSFLHSTGTDRLWVTWKLNSDRVKNRIRGDGQSTELLTDNIRCVLSVGDHLEPVKLPDEPSARKFIAIPADINALTTDDPELARSWRLATRAAFTSAFADGFLVEDFDLFKRNEIKCGRYLLSSSATANLS